MRLPLSLIGCLIAFALSFPPVLAETPVVPAPAKPSAAPVTTPVIKPTTQPAAPGPKKAQPPVQTPVAAKTADKQAANTTTPAKEDKQAAKPTTAPAKDSKPPSKPEPSKIISLSLAQISQQKADTYAAALDQWLKSASPTSLEPVLAHGQEAAAAILAAADTLDEANFAALRQKMQGYFTMLDEVIVVVPDSTYFIEQTQKHGLPADVAFFDLMHQTLNQYWPVTMEQLDDLSGCTRYGSHDLVRLYGAWKNFQKQYPGAYEKLLRDPNMLLLGDIEDQLINGTSACEGPESVADEFETFIKTYPDSDLTPKLKQRLDDLRKNKLDMSFFQGIKYNQGG